jgi:hypothetical protein
LGGHLKYLRGQKQWMIKTKRLNLNINPKNSKIGLLDEMIFNKAN